VEIKARSKASELVVPEQTRTLPGKAQKKLYAYLISSVGAHSVYKSGGHRHRAGKYSDRSSAELPEDLAGGIGNYSIGFDMVTQRPADQILSVTPSRRYDLV
jgi:hypothetical protein